MAFSVRITYVGGGTRTLPINAVYGPTFTEIRGQNAEPSPLAVVEETWTLEGRIRSSDSAGDWTTIRAELFSISAPATKIEILRNGGAFHALGGTGYERFRLEEVAVPAASGAWASHVPFTIRATAQRPPTAGTVLRAALTFSYDDAGLATRRWSGAVRTPSGTSATSSARTLGTLALPGGTWTFLTSGPEGLDVTASDGSRDTEAEWESVAREHGESAPGGVGEFAHEVEERVTRDADGNLKTVTTIRGSAAGTGALTYVQSLRPSSLDESRVTQDVAGVRASAEYVIESQGQQDEENARGDGNIKRRFIVRGAPFGGLNVFAITGDHDPVIQRGGRMGWTITEEIEVTGTDVTSISSLGIPSVLAELADWQDGPERNEIPAEPIKRGATSDQDVYKRTVTRVFKIPFAPPENAMVVAVLDAFAANAGGAGALVGGAAGGSNGGVGGSNEGSRLDSSFRLTSAGRQVKVFGNSGSGMLV